MKRILLTVVAVAATAFASALAVSPAQDLYDEATFYLQFNYAGPSTVDLKGLIAKYQGELDKACAPKGDACPYDAAYDLLTKLTEDVNDGHTYYLPPQESGDFQSQLGGGQTSSRPLIGIQTARIKGTNDRRVVLVYDKSPGKQAGIQRGDRIVSVNGQALPAADDANAKFITDFVSQGKPVTLTIMRRDGSKPDAVKVDITVTPQAINLASVPALEVRPDGVAILTVPGAWADGSADAIHTLVKQAEDKNAKAIVVDLRDNAGGISTECQAAVSAFVAPVTRIREDAHGRRVTDVQKGDTIYRVDSKGSEIPTFKLSTVAKFDGPLDVLVNEGSGSCSEYFASDIQLAKRGKVLGAQTAGVGNTGTLVHELIDGSAIVVTEVRSYISDGKTRYPAAVKPDVVVSDDYDNFLATGIDTLVDKAAQDLLGNPGK